MSEDLNSQDGFELIEAALRREVPPEEPLRPEFEVGIVAAIRSVSSGRRRVLMFRRFALGAAALAAAVLLVIGLLAALRIEVPGPRHVASPNTNAAGKNILAKIPPARGIVDNSIVAVEEFATDSVVQEMRDLARDASDIGSAMLASLPVDVMGPGGSRWLSGSEEK
ncbi:MAG: hypothetical protein QGG42_18800 [Phycisphaerae bacterium]|jgi:hypothetical protein|nr:hypothetical protein [Phycisphaerae bacterium]